MPTIRVPMTLRLPFGMVDQHLRLEQILAADQRRSWSESLQWLPCFVLSRPEHRFARQLLERKRNIWLFRCNQKKFCGDFITVDMSAQQLDRRSVTVIELKSKGQLTLGGGGAGNQFQNAREAVDELAITSQVVAQGVPFSQACGDAQLVQQWIE